MKRFDYESVKSRMMKRAMMKSEFATILDDGSFGNLMDVVSESISEVARYGEYQLLEKKWSTAQNMSSLTSMGSLIGRKRQRPKSAIGYIIVSHTDSNGLNRLANYGVQFFDIDEYSDFDDIVQNQNATYVEQASLVPWTYPAVYTIPKGTIFKSSTGAQFISTESVKSRILTKPFSNIQNNDALYSKFLEAGGWDGIKYLKIPVIQGIERKTELGIASGDRFQTLSIDGRNIENASNMISRQFFYIEIIDPTTDESEKWVEIQRIRLAGPYDKVFEAKLSKDSEKLIIKFGDGISGMIPPVGSRIELHYLETLGARGNIEAKFQVGNMVFPNGESIVDPRTGYISNFLSCTNINSIMGGKDMEDDDEYRISAPISYLKSYTTAVKSSYEQQILENSPISLSKIVCYPSSSFVAKQVDTSFNDNVDEEVVNELSVISNTLNVSAIKSNGDKVTDAESSSFIKTIIKSIGDQKGPNDSLSYVEPNFIKIAPSIKINTFDIATTESEIQKDIKAAVSSVYSIFNTTFKTPFYSSKVSYIASLFGFTDSVGLNIEALADVSYDRDDIKVFGMSYGNNQTQPLVAIPFHFDKVFSASQIEAGFKNVRVSSSYLLKINMKYINAGSFADSKNRTFFLYDNRTNVNVSLTDTIKLEANTFALESGASSISSSNSIGERLIFFDEKNNTFKDRTVRLAQYPYISDITDDTFMDKAKSFIQNPKENRPYETNDEGNIKEFNTTEVESSLRVFANGSSSSAVCYKKNDTYIDYVNVLFYENYTDVGSIDYARGWFIIPVSYFEFGDNLPSWSMEDESNKDYITKLSQLLKSYIDLKVYAKPVASDFEPKEYNSIIFVDDDDIRVEKNLKYKD